MRQLDQDQDATRNSQTPSRPIIFVGPSVSLDIAKRALFHADYRPPIKRGDLDSIPSGTIVGIIDGVFGQTLAISPDEIRRALDRGVTVYGAASMGAMRAAEVRGVIGVGQIFEMYSTGTIERDDEVALLFDPHTYRPVTEPLINVRYAVERLVRSATLSRDAGNAIIKSCSQLHFSDRTYEAILQNSKLAANVDGNDIIRLLRNFNLKRDDAHFLLETIAEATSRVDATPRSVAEPALVEAIEEIRANDQEHSNADILIWETGDRVHFSEIVQFLKVTGMFEKVARNALGRFALAGLPLRPSYLPNDADSEDTLNTPQSLMDFARIQWGWLSPEEAHVSMRDIGLGLLDAVPSLEAESVARRYVALFAKHGTAVFMKALRSELWMNDISLKREVLRLGAVQFLAKRGAEAGPPTEAELSDAKRSICRVRTDMQWSFVESDLNLLGVPPTDLAAFVKDYALARRAARPIVGAMDRGRTPSQTRSHRAFKWRELGLRFEPSIKTEESNRFSLALPEAEKIAERIAKQMGITRIGLIGELDTLGVHVAQAFGDRCGWSNSFSSGKATTREGARIGSIMEEAEVHSQDAFQTKNEIRRSFANSVRDLPLVDPRELNLPYDSRYRDTVPLDWAPCFDLLSCRKMFIPSACLVNERLPNDICYSPRLGGKMFSTSGLASGFTLAEAAVHAAAEYIERHAQRLAEIELDNPGGVGARQFWFVDLGSLPETPRRIVETYRKAGVCVRIVDITSEIAVPTFAVKVFEDPFVTHTSMSSDGWACHPDPEVAVTMALLEAAQTRAGRVAAAREDYALRARSLGRHERPRTILAKSQVFWFSNDRPVRPFQATIGFTSRDILEELEWIVDRVQDAGVDQFLVVEYTMSRIRPAFAVRVIIPGLETSDPLYTGARARVTFVRDLLPAGSAGSV